MPALMELVDHMGPLRLMQPAGPMESVNYSNLQQTLDQSTLDIVFISLLRQTWYLKLFVELLFRSAAIHFSPFPIWSNL